MTTLVKQKTLRDPAHLKWLKQLPCMKCNRVPCDPAHIRKFGGGGTALKPPDSRCVPLCRECHNYQHSVGEPVFWGGEDGVWRAIDFAERLYKVTGNWEAGCKVIVDYRRGA